MPPLEVATWFNRKIAKQQGCPTTPADNQINGTPNLSRNIQVLLNTSLSKHCASIQCFKLLVEGVYKLLTVRWQKVNSLVNSEVYQNLIKEKYFAVFTICSGAVLQDTEKCMRSPSY